MDSFSVRLGKAPSAGERQQVGALVRADGLEKFAKVADLWLHRPEGIDTLKRRWAMFLNEYPLYRTQFEQDQPTPELSTEDVEANRLRMVAMYGDLDKNYYVEKLKEAKADYDVNGQLFDEKTRQEMRDQIAEYEATVKEMAA
ncbi:MAG TPA: hypothetical protein VMO76_14855 [Candidatus Udaeobacter sp.]|nr:hypothetical protein [Candidatus Udaeobacter sp.]